MKILLSAYACEPNRGSEPGVGWNWALALAKRGHEVWVITRSNNQECIEAELKKNPASGSLYFYYYDLPAWILRFKKMPGGVYWYYLLWQVSILRLSRKLHATVKFDIAHHITFAVFRQPSFIWKLEIPFIFGPLGGGETSPRCLRKSLSLRNHAKEIIRDISNTLALMTPLSKKALKSASFLIAKTPETSRLMTKYPGQTLLKSSEIGTSVIKIEQVKPRSAVNRILFVGRFIYWKGGHLAITAFAEYIKSGASGTLTMVGKGPEKEEWIALAKDLEVHDMIDFIDWLPQKELAEIYKAHDVFLFPSMHDSGGTVVLEAMSYGLPVVCLKLGGPGELVDGSCGIPVIVNSSSTESTLVKDLAEALKSMSSDTLSLKDYSVSALKKSRDLSWDNVVGAVYGPIEAWLVK